MVQIRIEENLGAKLLNSKSMINFRNIILNTSIDVSIEFGDPKRDCAGLGICKMNISNPANVKKATIDHCSTTKAKLISYDYTNGSVALIFSKNELCGGIMYKYFNDSIFRLDSTFNIPIEITQALKLDVGHITRGNYPILIRDNKYIVIFKNTKPPISKISTFS